MNAVQQSLDVSGSAPGKLNQHMSLPSLRSKPTGDDVGSAVRICVEHDKLSAKAMVEHGNRGLIRIQQREGTASGVFVDVTGKRGQVLPAIDDRKNRESAQRQGC